MLLLDKDVGTTSLAESIRKIVIISPQAELTAEVAEILRTRGFENLEIIHSEFASVKAVALSADEVLGVIVDIGIESDVDQIAQAMQSFVPQNVWCCLVGQSDSISLAQRFLNQNLLYFHSDTQLEQMVARIVSGINIPRTRSTVSVAVLGCKGGCGASLISAHIAHFIASDKSVPVLLAQGHGGSQDLDLMFDKKLQNEIVEYEDNLHLYRGEPYRLSDELLSSYNYVVYDQPIFNLDKEQFADLIEKGSNFVLVVERRVGSLRLARQFLDEVERLRNNMGKAVRTFICISDTSAENARLMALADIERLLKTQVDATIPFLRNTAPTKVLDVKLGRNGTEAMNTLAMRAIGMIARKPRKERKDWWGSIVNYLLNK